MCNGTCKCHHSIQLPIQVLHNLLSPVSRGLPLAPRLCFNILKQKLISPHKQTHFVFHQAHSCAWNFRLVFSSYQTGHRHHCHSQTPMNNGWYGNIWNHYLQRAIDEQSILRVPTQHLEYKILVLQWTSNKMKYNTISTDKWNHKHEHEIRYNTNDKKVQQKEAYVHGTKRDCDFI
jgi:hypothetical protein